MVLTNRLPKAVATALALFVVLTPQRTLRAESPGADPAVASPVAPSMASIELRSGEAILNGLVYRAAGDGPHPVALFLHGFPGNEKNLDLAQAVRRAGWDAVYFDYRGSWGSGGTFSFEGSLDDVMTALAWIRSPEVAAKHSFDPGRIALVGHSFGGWLALRAARDQPAEVCVAAIAAWNVGWLARHREDAPDYWALLLDDLEATTNPAGGPLRASAETLRREVEAAPAAWDYVDGAAALKDRALLLVAATRDTRDEDPAMHDRLAAAVRAAGGDRVLRVDFDDDHVFSASRLALGETLTRWLNGECAAGRAGRAGTRAAVPREGRIRAPDGVELWYQVRGSGPRTLVVLHGGPGLSSAYLAPDLAVLEDDFTLIHYDQRGAGRSTVVSDPERLRLADHVADVEAVRRHFGLERMTLLGHSWGAGPAAFYALRHPETTDRVTLLDPMPPRRTPYMERFGEALVGAMDEATRERFEAADAARAEAPDPVAACRAYWELLMPSYFPDPADVARVKGEICDMPAEAIRNGDLVYEAALGEAGEGDWDWRERFHGVSVPVLVLFGADSALPAEGHAEWKAAFPNAELVAIDGVGHFLHVERPDAFRDAVVRFLE